MMNEPVSGIKPTFSGASGPKLSIRQMAMVGVMAAVTCVLAPFSIPIGPVPISLTNFAVYMSLYVLGMKEGTLSYLIYLLLGLIGLPVFSGFTSGPEKLFGPTGGYLIGFIPMAVLSGIAIDWFYGAKASGGSNGKRPYPASKQAGANSGIVAKASCIGGMALGTIICYILGTAWLAYQANLGWKAALFAGVVPFVPGDLAKIAVAALAGPKIRGRLVQAGLRAEDKPRMIK